MQPDLEKYRAFLDDYDLSEDQKTELIHSLWGIMESFVDSAFGMHPAQQVISPAQEPDSVSDEEGLQFKEQFKMKTLAVPSAQIPGEEQKDKS